MNILLKVNYTITITITSVFKLSITIAITITPCLFGELFFYELGL